VNTKKILSVTVLTGKDTIFRATELSRQLGLELGDVVPCDIVPPDTLFLVESARLKGRQAPAEKVRHLRNELNLSVADFAKFLGVTERTVELWEREGATSLVYQEAPDYDLPPGSTGLPKVFAVLKRLQD
jgi:DNA-binding XRE family transcriptional regulator